MAKGSKVKANPNAGTALANWDEDLAKYAQEQAALEQMPGGNKISFESGIISIAGKPVEKNTLDVVILDFIYENTYYVGKYDKQNPSSPVCFAFGRSPEEMVAHSNSTQKQNPQEESTGTDGKKLIASPCMGCPQNAFGTADGGEGRGKACKNGRRLAIMAASDLKNEKSVAKSEIFYARLSALNSKGWALYLKGLSALTKRPSFGVVTRITTAPDPKSQFKVVLEVVESIDNGVMAAVMAKVEEARKEIAFPYQPSVPNANPKAKAKGSNKGDGKAPKRKY